ncbi:MAG: hypothetical protein AB7G37_07355 [Solirubrobacteraceae bacterium]
MFCRHGRREDHCVICKRDRERDQARKAGSRPARTATRATRSATVTARRPGSGRTRSTGGVRVTKLARHADDGWRHELLPGIRAAADARDLIARTVQARGRIDRLASDPVGPYARAADQATTPGTGPDEAAWTLFQIAYYGPLPGAEPFAQIDGLIVGLDDPLPDAETLRAVTVGPRGAHAADRGDATLRAFRDWAARGGGAHAALQAGGTDPARRFDATYRALALPGFDRAARYEFVLTLGALGLVDVRPWSLLLDAGRDPVSVAAKRLLQTGDPVLLQRRLGDLARELDLPVGAFDLGLRLWDDTGTGTAIGQRLTVDAGDHVIVAGVPVVVDPDEVALRAAEIGAGPESDEPTGEAADDGVTDGAAGTPPGAGETPDGPDGQIGG